MPSHADQDESRRSGAVAVSLSFVLPGLGQGYLGRLKAALAFALPSLLLLLAVVAGLWTEGPARAALRLLDPAIALLAVGVLVAAGAWRAWSVVHAWRAGRPSRAGAFLVGLLTVAIVVSHGLGVAYTWTIRQAGERIFSGDSSTIFAPEEQPTPQGQPADTPTPANEGPAATSPSPAPSPSTDPTPLPTDSELPPAVQVPEGDLGVRPWPPSPVLPTDLDAIDDGWLNVLLVGIDWTPGRDHALTDTLIVVTVDTATGDVFMFSFPRDIAEFPLYDGGTFLGRLNSFANYAQRNPQRYPDGGLRSLANQLGFLLGVPIDHYAAINLPGFKKVIEAVGGVTVYNERALEDPGFGFRLSAGEHHLDADQALKFARSRHGPGNNDFFRARRQQQLLAALRNEIMSPRHVADLPQMIEAIAEVIRTDFPPSQIDQVLRLAELVSSEPSGSWVFSNPEWAYHPPLSETRGRWIIRLDVARLKKLSRELFAEDSLHSR